MHYLSAEYLRDRLEDANNPFSRMAKLNLPPCNDDAPCLDGRCSVCGSQLDEMIDVFRSSEHAESRAWYRGAYVLKTGIIAVGDKREFEFTGAKAALSEIAEEVSGPDSTFIGAWGLIVDPDPEWPKKFAAIEFCCTNVTAVICRVQRVLSDRFARAVAVLPYHPNMLKYNGGEKALSQDLLIGYVQRDPRVIDVPETLDDQELMAEVAQNYGPHSILDRLVTRGLAVEHAEIVPSPACKRPLELKSFRRASCSSFSSNGGANVAVPR